jgi:hypothetical protein
VFTSFLDKTSAVILPRLMFNSILIFSEFLGRCRDSNPDASNSTVAGRSPPLPECHSGTWYLHTSRTFGSIALCRYPEGYSSCCQWLPFRADGDWYAQPSAPILTASKSLIDSTHWNQTKDRWGYRNS